MLRVICVGCWCALLLLIPGAPGQAPMGQPPTGPAAERRFPPLKMPPGFKATLFACDPMIEYPSAVARGPRTGSIFVAVDYMTGLGTEIVRRDEIRLLEDTDGDGYADKVTVVATGFNSIQGLTYHGDTLYVMHAPFLTALRSTKGDGKFDERRDLLTGLGLPPEKNPPRLHCANGLVMGHDGWLYLALGDHGCDVPLPGKSNLVLNGGGILRCRRDGTGVHIFATGLRNIYDVALDEDLNVFVRDNENDGGTYMIRVCHSFFGADHGYPYLYEEHPDEALAPLADLGLGSSAGGLCYLEPRFPAEYRGNLFFCEWGKSVVRYRPERAGSSFGKLKEIVFASGADNDPYPFKPTDLVVGQDGALFVVDWADGQRPKRGRGRVYRITPTEKWQAPPEPAGDKTQRLLALLDSESYYRRVEAQMAFEQVGHPGAKVVHEALRQKQLGVRGRMHAVWVLARVGVGRRELLKIAGTDPEPRVQVQALRALADIIEPAEANTFGAELAEFGKGKDPRVILEVVLMLGRLDWSEAPNRLGPLLGKSDGTLEHAAMQTLRRSGNWPAVLKLLDRPNNDLLRTLALRAIADRTEPVVVDGVIERLSMEKDATRRLAYVEALARLYKKPGPWVYWGYRPAPRAAGTVAWDKTDAVRAALDRALNDPHGDVRLVALQRMRREKIPVGAEALSAWLLQEREPNRVAAILEEARSRPAGVLPTVVLAKVVRDRGHTVANRLLALTMLPGPFDTEISLDGLAGTVEDGPVLAELLRRLGRLRSSPQTNKLLLGKLTSAAPEVRAAALEALTELRVPEAGAAVPKLLNDADPQVRRAAAVAAGKLEMRSVVKPLLDRTADADPQVRRASFDALRLLKEPSAFTAAIAALKDPHTELAALRCLTQLENGKHGAYQVEQLALRNPSAEIREEAVRALSTWERPASVVGIQSATGTLALWLVTGPLQEKEAEVLVKLVAQPAEFPFDLPKTQFTWQSLVAVGTEARWKPGKAAPGSWVAVSDVVMKEDTDAQFLAAGSGPYRVWLNGKLIHQGTKAAALTDADRFTARLGKGPSRLVVQLTAPGNTAEFQLRFRRVSSKAAHEKLTEAALTRKGNAERGRKIFLDVNRSSCLKCHRLGDQGEKIGPELTGVGDRLARVYLIESILEPSRTIAPSFETLVVEMSDGKLFSGVAVAETAATLTLADNEGKKHTLAQADIVRRNRSPLSTMPDGLEQRLTVDEFVDLIAFLASQKGVRDR
jgi:putative membrane-bound dehydrogenase-like protein